jgi:hypothetical protein
MVKMSQAEIPVLARLVDPRNPPETPGDLLEHLAASEHGPSVQN